MMANAIAEGGKTAGADTIVIAVDDATKDDVVGADLVALGCPSMGAEVLRKIAWSHM